MLEVLAGGKIHEQDKEDQHLLLVLLWYKYHYQNILLFLLCVSKIYYVQHLLLSYDIL